MPALATYSSDKTALIKATMIGATLSGMFLIFSFLPQQWQLFDIEPNFIGDMVACLFMGKYHIGYNITSAFGLLVTHGSLFALAISGFLWKNNWKMGSYHIVMAFMTLFMPQWIFGVTTGEAAAMYCFYSIPITGSFMPYFKKFFTVSYPDIAGRICLRKRIVRLDSVHILRTVGNFCRNCRKVAEIEIDARRSSTLKM